MIDCFRSSSVFFASAPAFALAIRACACASSTAVALFVHELEQLHGFRALLRGDGVVLKLEQELPHGLGLLLGAFGGSAAGDRGAAWAAAAFFAETESWSCAR